MLYSALDLLGYAFYICKYPRLRIGYAAIKWVISLASFFGGLRLLTRGQLTDLIPGNTLFTEITTIRETMEVIR